MADGLIVRGLALLCFVTVGCTGFVTEPDDAGVRVNDAGVDDAGPFDAGVDAGIDAGVDAGIDAGVDAGIDAGVDAGVDAGPCDGAELCETFEGWPLGPLTTTTPPGWPLHAVRSTVEVAQLGFDGGRGLRIELAAQLDADGTIDVPLSPTFPARGYHLFARVRLFAEVAPALGEQKRHGFVGFIGKSPGTNDYAHVTVRHDSGRTPYFNYFVNPPFIDCAGGTGPAAPLPTQTWLCYEMEVDDTTSSARVWFDGGIAPEAEMSMRGFYCGDGNAQRVWAFPELGALKVGVFSFDAFPIRVLIDEVAVSRTRLKCESAR